MTINGILRYFVIFLTFVLGINMYGVANADEENYFTHDHDLEQLTVILQDFKERADDIESPDFTVVTTSSPPSDFLSTMNPFGYNYKYIDFKALTGDMSNPEVRFNSTLFYTISNNRLRDLHIATVYEDRECPGPSPLSNFKSVSDVDFILLKDYFKMTDLEFNNPRIAYKDGLLTYETADGGCATIEKINFAFNDDEVPDGIKVYLDGKLLEFDVTPDLIEGTTLVPMRKIFEEQGVEVQWDGTTNTVIGIKGDITVSYQIGANVAHVNGKQIALSVPGQIKNDRTLIPLRFVSESLGNFVGWEGYTQTISISSIQKIESIVTGHGDGGTIKVIYMDQPGTEETVRLIGIEILETDQPYGTEALDIVKSMLPVGSKVYIEIDEEMRDNGGNLLGYVYLEDGTQLNAKLLAEGLVRVATSPPNVRWTDFYVSLQKNAYDEQRGLWHEEY